MKKQTLMCDKQQRLNEQTIRTKQQKSKHSIWKMQSYLYNIWY